MSSTEHNIGLSERSSSRVLKPPVSIVNLIKFGEKKERKFFAVRKILWKRKKINKRNNVKSEKSKRKVAWKSRLDDLISRFPHTK